MITAVEIENFKGVRERTRIEVRPITLLFGPNSAGKSTLLHALQLAREVFTRRNLDVDVTDGGANFIDLGGFRNYVHGRDLTKAITLRFDLDLSSTDFLTGYPITEFKLPIPDRNGDERDVSTIGDDIRSGWVEIVIRWSNLTNRPYLSQFSVGYDGEGFAQINVHPQTTGTWIDALNIHHPLVRWSQPVTSFGVIDALLPRVRNIPAGLYFGTTEPVDRADLPCADGTTFLIRTNFSEGAKEWSLRRTREWHFSQDADNDTEGVARVILAAAPDGSCVRLWGAEFNRNEWSDEQAQFAFDHEIHTDGLDRGAYADALARVYDEDGGTEITDLGLVAMPDLDRGFEIVHNAYPWDVNGTEESRSVLTQLLNRLLLVPARLVRSALAEFRYVGPVRDAVPRHLTLPRFHDARRWAGGLAAWEELTREPAGILTPNGISPERQDIAAQVNEWLSSEDRLNTGFGLRVEQFRELPTEHELSTLLERGALLDEIDSDKIKGLLRSLPVLRRLVLVSLSTQQKFQPADVGQGITQAVPVIVAAIQAFGGERPRGGLVAIEQPELHLNPRQQAALGDVFLAGALQSPKNRLILETHSEHLILRLQRRIREATERRETLRDGGGRNRMASIPPPERAPVTEPLALDVRDVDIGVVYVRSTDGRTLFEPMALDLTGEFVLPWPDDFFEIDFHERFGK
ncbi:AAA family ATPase [Gemmata sp. JC673]|uniref:AAA family ATPase n=1 Tax=Gemmata algarum TaxID=2975278 RepID=A0ABU5F599_9BACT|nr:AAA family ATPase [Gemmata algarum]MDY3561972.1 AAA family ATPase [Gemmata algarum]